MFLFLAVALLSAGALAYEVLLARLFSIVQWHHFAYMIISVALLGYGYWKSRYNGREDIVGQTVRFDTEIATIVGVLPAWYNARTPVVLPLRIVGHEAAPARAILRAR